MTLHQLRIFGSVARFLNLTRASAELQISQPSVSQQLKLLQKEYGVKLYETNRRGIQLTEAGHALWKDIEPVLLQVERLKDKFRSNVDGQKSVFLTVGASYTPSTSFFPLLLAGFKEIQPNVHINLRTARSRFLEQLVANAEAEIALITTPTHLPTLVYERYRSMKLVAFASAQHPLAKKQRWTLADLIQAPLIHRKDQGGRKRTDELLQQMEKRGFKPNVLMHFDSPQAVKAAVKTGIGIGILLKETLEPELRKGEFKILRVPELKIRLESFVIHPKDKPLSQHAQSFLRFLRDWRQTRRRVRGSLRAA